MRGFVFVVLVGCGAPRGLPAHTYVVDNIDASVTIMSGRPVARRHAKVRADVMSALALDLAAAQIRRDPGLLIDARTP